MQTNSILTTILAASSTALIGGFLTYFFARMQEKQKALDAKQKELGERRIRAVDDMRVKIISIVEDFCHWTQQIEQATRACLKTLDEDESHFICKDVKNKELVAFIQQGDKIFGKASSLRGYYQAQKLYLETPTHNVWESFDTEFNKQYSPLSSKLKYAAEKLLELDQSIMETVQKRAQNTVLISPIFTAVAATVVPKVLREIAFQAKERKRYRDQLQTLMEEILNTAKFARDWNPQTYVDAFNAEAERLVSTQPR